MRSMLRSAPIALMATLAFGAFAAASASAAAPEFTIAPGTVRGTISSASFGGFGAKWTYTDGSLGGFSAEGLGKTQLSPVTFTLREGSTNACINAEGKSFVASGLKAKLGYISKAKAEVGLMLQANTGPFGTCQFFKQEELNWQYTGVVTGRITPVNTKTKKFTVAFNVIAGKQQFLFFEGEKASKEVFPLKLNTGAVTVEQVVSLETEAETEIVA